MDCVNQRMERAIKGIRSKRKKGRSVFSIIRSVSYNSKTRGSISCFFEQPFNNDLDQYFQELSECMPSRINNKWQDELPSLFELFEIEWKSLKKQGEPTLNDFSQDSKNQLTKFIRLLQQFDELYKKQKLFQGALDFTDLQQKH